MNQKIFFNISIVPFLLVTACAVPVLAKTILPPTPKIVGGQLAVQKDQLAKTVVSIVIESSEGQALCSGTLLTVDTVLTAAHCVDHQPTSMNIVFGPSTSAGRQDLVRPVTQFVQTDQWQQTQSEGDLAVLLFSGGVPQGFLAAGLAPESMTLNAGDVVELYGFGIDDPSARAGAGSLRTTQSTILGQKSADQYVVDGSQSGVCFGDSGGPAFVEYNNMWVLWGVASAVSTESCNQMSVHTAVMSWIDWIRSSIQNLRQQQDPG